MNTNPESLPISGATTGQSGHQRFDGFIKDNMILEERSFMNSKMSSRSSAFKKQNQNAVKNTRFSTNNGKAINTSTSMMTMTKTSTANAHTNRS